MLHPYATGKLGRKNINENSNFETYLQGTGYMRYGYYGPYATDKHVWNPLPPWVAFLVLWKIKENDKKLWKNSKFEM
jgi:hypothetical protein